MLDAIGEGDWSLFLDPLYLLPLLVGFEVLAAMRRPPFRYLWAEVRVALAGGVMFVLGWLAGFVYPDVKDPLYILGAVMMVTALWIFLQVPGDTEHEGSEPRDVDHSVASHDISDPETAALYDPKALEVPTPEEDPDRFRDESVG